MSKIYQEALNRLKSEAHHYYEDWQEEIPDDLLYSEKLIQKLVDKETSKKVDIKISKTPGCDPRNFHCPTCSRKLRRDRSYQYCPRCGQKLYWGEVDE